MGQVTCGSAAAARLDHSFLIWNRFLLIMRKSRIERIPPVDKAKQTVAK